MRNETLIDVEIQLEQGDFWPERSLYYWSRMYAIQIHAGEGYNMLKKCIHVGILDFPLFPEDETYYSRFHLREDNRDRIYSDKIEIHTLELPKLAKFDYPETELLRWSKFINAERREEFEMMAKTDPTLKKAYDHLLHLSADEQKRLEYEAREKAIKDYNTQMGSSYRRGREEGKQLGIQQTMDRYARLTNCLAAENKLNKLVEAVNNKELLEQLYTEYNIQ